jgi:hypothetical protein
MCASRHVEPEFERAVFVLLLAIPDLRFICVTPVPIASALCLPLFVILAATIDATESCFHQFVYHG